MKSRGWMKRQDLEKKRRRKKMKRDPLFNSWNPPPPPAGQPAGGGGSKLLRKSKLDNPFLVHSSSVDASDDRYKRHKKRKQIEINIPTSNGHYCTKSVLSQFENSMMMIFSDIPIAVLVQNQLLAGMLNKLFQFPVRCLLIGPVQIKKILSIWAKKYSDVPIGAVGFNWD
jgi:hypothetical protein